MVDPDVPDFAAPAPSMRARRRLGGLELLFLGVAAIVLLLAAGLSIEVRFDGRAGGEERVGEVRALLVDEGFRVAATNRARQMDDVIYFTDGFEDAALRAAEILGFERVEPMEALPPERRLSSSVMLHVIVGAG